MSRESPSLWSDPPEDSDHQWLAAPPAARPRRAQRPEPGPPSSPRRRRWPLIGLAAAVLLLAGLGAAALVDVLLTPDREATQATLPATPGRPADSRINEIYEQASAGVVSVQAARGGGRSSGTGFVVDGDGTIVTNAHVVGDARSAQVRFDDGDRTIRAEVVGSDPSSDLAVLRVDPSRVRNLLALPLANSDDVKVGDTAIAIGYPLGLDRTATAGIVSGLRREIQAPNGFRIDEVIQTDAPINPGNSGGPLLDAQGRVIGVNSQIVATGAGGGNVGIGFAVPSNTVRSVVPQLKAGRTIERAYLGVSTTPSPGDRGAVVRAVSPGGPAQRAGLSAATAPDGSDGDVIVSVGGDRVTDPDDVARAVDDHRPGDRVEVTVRRDGREVTLGVRLGRRPLGTP